MKIAIIGTGYVGLVTGVCLASQGHQVICVDKEQSIVAGINHMQSPIYEPGLQELIAPVVSSGNLVATTALKAAVQEAEVSLIAVGTPLGDKGIDLDYVKSSALEIGAVLKEKTDYHVVCVKSTVVPATTDTLVRGILEAASGKRAGEFGLAMNPEFLREGKAVLDFMHPDRIVIGAYDDRSFAVMEGVYAGFDAPIVRTNLRTAEMIKYTANALLATLISYANEIASLCEATGEIDVQEVLAAVALDKRFTPRINNEVIYPELLQYLQAGCGFGGSCFPKDLKALLAFGRDRGCLPRIVSAAIAINEEQAERILAKLEDKLGSLAGKKIAVLGLAFKPGTDDVRESPSIRIIKGLLQKGAEVCAADPIALEKMKLAIPEAKGVRYTKDYKLALLGAAGALLVTPWQEYLEIPPEDFSQLMHYPLVMDCRRALPKTLLESAGVIYAGVGLA